MRNLMLGTLAALAVSLALPVAAQTCSDPIAISSSDDTGTFSGDTCAAANPLTMIGGFAPSPQPDIVYAFVAGADSASLTLTTDASSTLIPGVYVLDACTDTAAWKGSATSSPPAVAQTLTVPLSTFPLTAGQTYYLVVSSSFNQDVPTDNCGTFTGQLSGSLPVTLQKFSVD